MPSLKYLPNSQDLFFYTLKKDVFNALPDKYREKASRIAYIKALLLLSFFIGVVLLLYSTPIGSIVYLGFAVLLGVSCLPLILNIGHESVHGNFSTSKGLNKMGKGVFYLLGTSAYFWRIRHTASHHAFANVKNVDLDIEQTTIVRLSKHQEHEPRHRYQHLYMPFAFCLYTLLWFFYRDFKDLGKKRFGAKKVKKHAPREVVKLIAAKVWHLLLLLVFPFLLNQTAWLVLTGFLAFHLGASIVTTFALISTHVGEEQEIVEASENLLPYSWAEHQLRTTADFSVNNVFLFHFFGGFNHHVAHHLFPGIPHVYYPLITPIIEEKAQYYGMPYHRYPTFFASAKSHFTRLKQLSNEI